MEVCVEANDETDLGTPAVAATGAASRRVAWAGSHAQGRARTADSASAMDLNEHTGATDMEASTQPVAEERLVTFTYLGRFFLCRAERLDNQTYKPVVVCRSRADGQPDVELPADTDNVSYATEAEALRHAEQQAMRWVHDRTGDGQGRL
jgi:hypothetical protein